MAIHRSSLSDGIFLWNIFEISTAKFQMELDPDGSMAMSWILGTIPKKPFISFALWQEVLSSWKMTSSSPKQFSIDGMRKLSKISMYTCKLIEEVLTAIILF